MKDHWKQTVLYGMVAGIVATIVMDVFVALAMIAMGNQASFMFEFIGDVAAACFARLHIPVAGGVLPGFLIHYLFGLGYGGLLCALLTWFPRLRRSSRAGSMALGIAYIEVLSQPFLITAPLVLPMSAVDTLQWYALSTAMHAVYGAVLGILLYGQAAIMARAAPRSA